MADSLLATDLTQDLGSAPATIASGAALSGAVDLKASRAHHINMPAGWTAADLTFQVSEDGTTWTDLYNTSGEYKLASAAVAASRSILLDLQSFFGIRHLKIRSGTAAAPVNQGAERALTITTVPR